MKQIRELRLEKYRLAIMDAFPNRLLDAEMKVDPYTTAMVDRTLIAWRIAIYGGRVKSPVIICYPRDWWEAFKERWFPAWALAKWPAIQTERTIEFRAVYPEWENPMGGQPYAIRYIRDGADVGCAEASPRP